MKRLGFKILLAICLLDLTVTALGIHFGCLEEANSILNYYLVRWGLAGLILAKIFLVMAPLAVLEMGPRLDPIARRRIGGYYKVVISLYMSILLGSMLFQLA